MAAQLPKLSRFEPLLLEGKLHEAADAAEAGGEQGLAQHALLYLAAERAGDRKLADEQSQLLLAALEKGPAPQRELAEMLAGRQPPDPGRLRRLSIPPEQKRYLLAVVARRYPETAKELLPLARQLDFSPDGTSLCLRKLLD